MFSTILVPLDGTAESNAAVPVAVTVAQATGGTLTLLRVVPFDAPRIAADAEEDLRQMSEALPSSVAVHCLVAPGGAAREISAQIEDLSADLVIMRTHARVGVERAVLGSVTQEVLAHSRVPIMLLRPDERQITRISKVLVPVDGSPGGTLALTTAAGLCQTTGAAMQLVQVSMPAGWIVMGGLNGGMAYYDSAWDAEASTSAQSYVAGLVKRLRAKNVDAQGQTFESPHVADAIVAAADSSAADLIVMSTRALTGPARAVLGSTADAVVRSARVPVLLIHRTEEAEAAASEFAAEAGAAAPGGARSGNRHPVASGSPRK